MSCIETFHLWLRKPPVHEPLKVGSAFWRVILYVFSAFLLYTTYSVLAILGQDTELDGPRDMTWYEQIYVFISYFQSSVCMCIHTSPISFQGGQKPNNNQLESLICAPQVLILQVLFQAGKNLNSLAGRMISLFYRILAFLKSNL